MPTLQMPPDFDEVMQLVRERDDARAQGVRKADRDQRPGRGEPRGAPPSPAAGEDEPRFPDHWTAYLTRPLRAYRVPAAEPEDPWRNGWRERFTNAGLTVARAPYEGLDGPRWYARLEGKAFGRRNLAVCLDEGKWSDQLLRDRPFEELHEHIFRLDSGKPLVALSESDKPAPPPADPPEVLFVRECLSRGFELDAEPTKDGCRTGFYRGLWVALVPNRQLVQVGVRTPEYGNGRTYKHYPLAEALRLMDAELRPKTAAAGKPRGSLF